MPRKIPPKVWPSELDKSEYKPPEWTLGLAPGPNASPEVIAEFERKAGEYYADRDRDENAEIERLLGLWREFLGATDGCERDVLLRFATLLDVPAFREIIEPAENWIPRFKKAGYQPRVTSILEDQLMLHKVDDLIASNPSWPEHGRYVRAVKTLYPDTARKTEKGRKELRNKTQALSRAIKLRQSMRRPLP